jgi:hypothetical protein
MFRCQEEEGQLYKKVLKQDRDRTAQHETTSCTKMRTLGLTVS